MHTTLFLAIFDTCELTITMTAAAFLYVRQLRCITEKQ